MRILIDAFGPGDTADKIPIRPHLYVGTGYVRRVTCTCKKRRLRWPLTNSALTHICLLPCLVHSVPPPNLCTRACPKVTPDIKRYINPHTHTQVYFKVWRGAEAGKKTTYLEKVEMYCLQDLMHACIHASTPKMHANLLTVLDGLHSQKKARASKEAGA